MARLGLSDEEIEERATQLGAALMDANPASVARATLDASIFEGTLQAIEEHFTGQPRVKATMLQSMGDILRNLDLFERALGPQTEALRIRRDILGNDDPDTLSSIIGLGVLQGKRNQFVVAEALLLEGLAGRRDVLGDQRRSHRRRARCDGHSLYLSRKASTAEPLHIEALAIHTDSLGPHDLRTIESMAALASSLHNQNRGGEAEAIYRDALKRCQGVLDDEHPRIVSMQANLGATLHLQGRSDAAASILSESLDGLLSDLRHRQSDHDCRSSGSSRPRCGPWGGWTTLSTCFGTRSSLPSVHSVSSTMTRRCDSCARSHRCSPNSRKTSRPNASGVAQSPSWASKSSGRTPGARTVIQRLDHGAPTRGAYRRCHRDRGGVNQGVDGLLRQNLTRAPRR